MTAAGSAIIVTLSESPFDSGHSSLHSSPSLLCHREKRPRCGSLVGNGQVPGIGACPLLLWPGSSSWGEPGENGFGRADSYLSVFHLVRARPPSFVAARIVPTHGGRA